MIEYLSKPFSVEESLDSLNIFVRKWFESKYKVPTPPQRYSFKLISERKNVLITAPTGSGKTFSAFMSILSDLMNMSLQNKLEDKVYCIYVSPLRALNNDIYRNLSAPLDDIFSGITIPIKKITVGIRTGDTPQSERQKMLKKPPNILVTTPESLAILINSQKFVEKMKDLKYIVIDELHELANNKRGVHLSLSVERLREIVGHEFTRIGMGATLAPIEEGARYLVGYEGEKERDCYIVDATWDKRLDFKVISPVKDIINSSENAIDNSIYRIINGIIKENRTTLIFTNTRSGTERVVYNLMKRYKYSEGHIAAHHGSLSREARLGVEDMLKKGKLKVAVSSTSLELGIDIGTIDNVIQLGSPKSVARAVQRIGRSGHSFNDIARGEVIITDRDDLVECSVMLDAARKRHLDTFTTPKNALDVLAQHVVGMSQTRKWTVEEALAVVRNSYAYHSLQRKDFVSILEYLSGMYVGLESRRVYAKIWYDEKEGTFGRRGKLTKLIYFLNLGTIPDAVAIDVMTPDNKWQGSIEEEFLARLKPGDVFVLGGKTYRYDYARVMKAYVTPAPGQVPTIPPWYSEQLPLTYELALEIGRFREQMSVALGHARSHGKSLLSMLDKSKLKPNEESKAILDNMLIDENAKTAIFNYFAMQALYAGYIPNDRLVLIESTSDWDGSRNLLVFHSLYGRRINDALSRIFAIKLGELLESDIAINITDNGFVLITKGGARVSKRDVDRIINEVASSNMRLTLAQNIRRTEMMRRRFRYNAARSFMVLRNYMGKKISVRKQQINSQIMFKAAEEISPDFPIIKETYREIFEDVMDLPRAEQIAKKLASGEIVHKYIETDVPSPFSHTIVTFGEADVVMMEDRRKHIRELHKQVMAKLNKMVK
ncbi:MAG: ATP-dependent helicase [Candidatus Micrarchaeaceae archaeon]